VTVTVAYAVTVPPPPQHVSSNVLVADSGPVFSDPLVGRVPLQASAAAHVVAFVDVHDRLADPPLDTAVGVAVN
jgi:hypothetical protein